MSHLPRRLALGLVAAGTVACGGDDPPPTGPMTFAVSHYDYQFDLESRAATATLTLEVIEGGDCLTLPMRAQSPTEVTLDGEPATRGELVDDRLTLCGAGFFAGEIIELSATVTVPLDTWEDSQVGYSVATDLEGKPFYYLLSWLGGCDRFGPCDAAPDRFATYRFTVSHPAGTQVLCPGTITADDTLTICDFSWPGGPTYSTFAVVASPSWVKHDLGSASGVDLTLYAMPSSGITDALDVDQHLAFVTWMVDWFGPYPYGDQLRLITGPTYWLGFEHPGNIVLYDQLDRLSSAFYDQLSNTTNHEIAHMWAGDQTTLASNYDFVWKEAMAEYLSFAFEQDELDQPGQALTSARSWKSSAANYSDYYPVPDERPPLVDFYSHVYGAGPFVLLRHFDGLFDRETVFAALADLLGQPRAIGVTDVQSALETATGVDLDGYFDRWVYGAGKPVWPHFTVDVEDLGGGDVDLHVAQDAPESGLYGCAFSVRLQNTDTDESLLVWVDLGLEGMAQTTVRAHPGFPVNNTVFDPESNCLANLPAAARANRPLPPWQAPARPTPYQR